MTALHMQSVVRAVCAQDVERLCVYGCGIDCEKCTDYIYRYMRACGSLQGWAMLCAGECGSVSMRECVGA